MGPGPVESSPSRSTDVAPVAGEVCPFPETDEAEPGCRLHPPEVWGWAGFQGIPAGDKMAPNGVAYRPLFSLDGELNLGLVRNNELYLYSDFAFIAQRATAGVTNPDQGKLDFSKREVDVNFGVAWNYYESLEARVFGYTLNNLNRGTSLSAPVGFKDGFGLENRWYFGDADRYDVARRSFLSLGYYPSKSMVDGEGKEFKPGFFARAYVTYDFGLKKYYVYCDSEMTAERPISPKLLYVNGGLAARPFTACELLEFRLGAESTFDLKVDDTRSFLYLSVRILF
jgi:hypothetical protein